MPLRQEAGRGLLRNDADPAITEPPFPPFPGAVDQAPVLQGTVGVDCVRWDERRTKGSVMTQISGNYQTVPLLPASSSAGPAPAIDTTGSNGPVATAPAATIGGHHRHHAHGAGGAGGGTFSALMNLLDSSSSATASDDDSDSSNLSSMGISPSAASPLLSADGGNAGTSDGTATSASGTLSSDALLVLRRYAQVGVPASSSGTTINKSA